MKRSTPLARRTPLTRTRMARSHPVRDWTPAREKVTREAVCRACGATARDATLEAAHVVGRRHDQGTGGVLRVEAIDVVPLCGIRWDGQAGCHRLYDEHRLHVERGVRLLDRLTPAELQRAVEVAGGLGRLERRAYGRTSTPLRQESM